MSLRAPAFAAVAAALLVTAAAGVGLVAPTASATVTATADARPSALAADERVAADLTGLIERVDAVLEAALDLLRTLSELVRLVGGGGGGGGD